MKGFTARISAGLALIALAASAGAVSLSATGPAEPLPDSEIDHSAAPRADMLTAGSASLVPLMVADSAPADSSTIETTAPTGGQVIGKPVDDISFVARATVNVREDMYAARDAVAQLKDPELRQLAESLATSQDDTNMRLSRLAGNKGWPVPADKRQQPPPAGSASPDFDAKWTAEMIDGHERTVALYRAQAQGGEDRDLRKYARETLPTLEQNLESLRRLQK